MRHENGAKTKILLADDHRMVRQGFRLMLANEADLEVVGETDHGAGLLKLARDLKSDMVVMEARLPGLNPADVVKRIKNFEKPQAVLILTNPGDEDYALQLLLAGADGCIFETSPYEELAQTIRIIAAGKFICDPSIQRKILKRFGQVGTEANHGAEKLTSREAELLQLAAQGLDNKVIADRLILTVGTIKGYFGHIFNKMNVSSRTEAVVEGLKRGWVRLDNE